MKALVIFDTYYGNTKLIAETICKEIGTGCRLLHIRGIRSVDLKGLDLLVVGSPIIGWRPTERISKMLQTLREGDLRDIKAASFDTRIKMFLSGDAAKKISKGLKKAGADIISDPAYFFVKGKEGPLLEGEIQKAIEWAKNLKKLL